MSILIDGHSTKDCEVIFGIVEPRIKANVTTIRIDNVPRIPKKVVMEIILCNFDDVDFYSISSLMLKTRNETLIFFGLDCLESVDITQSASTGSEFALSFLYKEVYYLDDNKSGQIKT